MNASGAVAFYLRNRVSLHRDRPFERLLGNPSLRAFLANGDKIGKPKLVAFLAGQAPEILH
jgi:hypothetical protein